MGGLIDMSGAQIDPAGAKEVERLVKEQIDKEWSRMPILIEKFQKDYNDRKKFMDNYYHKKMGK